MRVYQYVWLNVGGGTEKEIIEALENAELPKEAWLMDIDPGEEILFGNYSGRRFNVHMKFGWEDER